MKRNHKTKTEVLAALSGIGQQVIPLVDERSSRRNVSIGQAIKDFMRERVILNGVPFIPDEVDENRCHAFGLTLKLLIQRITGEELSSGIIADDILKRGCRTSAGADSYFKVAELLCVEGTFVIQRSDPSDPPITLDVFLPALLDPGLCTSSSSTRNPEICSIIRIVNRFAIYDLAVVDCLTGIPSLDPPAWLEVNSHQVIRQRRLIISSHYHFIIISSISHLSPSSIIHLIRHELQPFNYSGRSACR
jgi:hypothetical protein